MVGEAQEKYRSELARMRSMVEAQSVMIRYAARQAVLWDRRWSKLRSMLKGWLAKAITPPFASDEEENAYEEEPDFHDAIDSVLALMLRVEESIGIEEPESVACDVCRATLGEEGQHHCRTHRVWYSTPTGEAIEPCPVGRLENELAKLRGGAS